MADKVLLSLGEKVDVYKQGDQAVKIFKKDYPKTEVLYEALVQARVEETGLPVPKINEIAKNDGVWNLFMDHIEGKTMAEIMKEDPANMKKYVEEMVDIQLEIHSKTSPMLNKLKDKLIAEIKSLDCISETDRYELLTRLDSMPKHKKLCHGNFSPSNVIVKDGKTYIVDWIAATQGNASADVARTYLLLYLDSPETAEYYMDLFCEKSKTDKKYVQAWLPIIAAAHLKNCKEEEKDFLMKWINVVDYE